MLKHYNWSDNSRGSRGRVAVKEEYGLFTMKQIAGEAPTPAVLFAVLADMGEEFLDRANEAHMSREDPWAVEVRLPQYGGRTFLLRYQRDADLGDAPVAAVVHVSCRGEFNGDVESIRVGDLVPIVEEMFCQGYYPGDVALEEAEITNLSFKYGAEVGLSTLVGSGELALAYVGPERDGISCGDQIVEFDDKGFQRAESLRWLLGLSGL